MTGLRYITLHYITQTILIEFSGAPCRLALWGSCLTSPHVVTPLISN